MHIVDINISADYISRYAHYYKDADGHYFI